MVASLALTFKWFSNKQLAIDTLSSIFVFLYNGLLSLAGLYFQVCVS